MNTSLSIFKPANLHLALLFAAMLGSPAAAQPVLIALASGNATPGSSVNLNITLASSPGASAAAVQWTMNYPPSAIAGVNVVTGPGALAAGKSVTCLSTGGATTCLLFGMNQNTIGDGVLATATFQISTIVGAGAMPIQINASAASTGDGQGIASIGTGGIVLLTGSPAPASAPTLSGLSCVPGSIRGPGTAACTLSLNGPLPATELAVSLSSDNSNLIVPAALQVLPGASTAVFTVTAAAVQTAQVATVTARTDDASRSFSLSLLPSVADPAYGTITVDVQIREEHMGTSPVITTPPFSSVTGGELLLAFIAAGNQPAITSSVVSVSGAGLTWVPVVATRDQGGTAEIWRAFSQTPLSNVSVTASLSQGVTSSLTVMSFAGVDPSGINGSGAVGAIANASAPAGAPTATILATRPNSLVVGVGNDPAGVIARTPGTGQVLVHQFLDPAGNTYWVQAASGRGRAGDTMAIYDSAPETDPYNLSVAEILPGPAVSSPLDTPVLTSLSGLPETNACSPGGLAALTGAGTPSPGVRVNGIPVPLLSSAGGQVTFECPLLPAGTPLDITVETIGSLARSEPSSMRDALPELLALSLTNQGIILYARGMGEPAGDLPYGTPSPDPPVPLKNRVQVVAGGVEIEPTSAVLVPGAVGLSRIGVPLLPGVPAGPAVPVYVRILRPDGSVVESNEVTLAIHDSASQ